MPTLFTIGYEGTSQAALIETLRTAGVELLVDVRALPASRRAGFSKTILAAGLGEAGIAYRHLRALGTPAAGRAAVRAGRPAVMREIYAAHLETTEAQHALAELRALVAQGPPACLLCLERQPAHCHRSIVAEHLADLPGLTVEHLIAEIN
jgi:uncharacterized protein (DUF488 family)